MSDFLRDFKKFTSKELASAIINITESSREWLLDKFGFEARRTRRAENYKIWRDDNHAVDMTEIDLMSARDYARLQSLIKLELV